MTSAQHLPKPPCKELTQLQLECGCIWPTYHPAAGYCFGMTTQALLLRAEHRSPCAAGGGICCCSAAKLCLTLCDSMDCSTPGSSVLHYLLKFAQNSCAWNQWCYLTISFSAAPFSSCLQSFPASESFPMSRLFTSGGQSIGASASASVLPMNIQDWFPVGWTGLISFQSKGLSGVFSSTTIWNHQFLGGIDMSK